VRADVAGLLLDGRVSRLGVESDRFARLGLRELRFSPGLRADIRLRQWDTEGPACGSVDLVHSRPLPVEVRRGRLGDAPSTSNAYRTEAEVFSPDPVDEALVASLFSGIARRARLWLGGPTLRATDGSLLTFEGARFVTSPEALLAVGALVHEARSWR
jgi:hypothetical protein